MPTSTNRAGPAEVGRPKERRAQVAAEEAVVHVIEEIERLRVELHAEAVTQRAAILGRNAARLLNIRKSRSQGSPGRGGALRGDLRGLAACSSAYA